MPSALERPTFDELYRRLRDLDYTQVDERMAVMLNAILQLEEQGECRESATEAWSATPCNIRPEDTYRRKIKLSPKTTG